jgi:hypothetical protein
MEASQQTVEVESDVKVPAIQVKLEDLKTPCADCIKCDVCEVSKSILRLATNIMGITAQYKIVANVDVQFVECRHKE